MIAALALKSLRNRKGSVALTVLSIALSVLLLLGVERVRDEARQSFTATVSGTDLIVGARTSPVHLLLYSVFNVGYANNNLSWATYRALASRPEVAWTVPLAMGDSHRGFRVVGTTADFYRHFRFGQGKALHFEQGAFGEDDHAVLGADVARRLGYRLGDPLVLAHGAGDVSFIRHEDHPFRVGGVLARTGTPVDRAIYVSLQAIADIHAEPSRESIDPLHAAADPLRTADPLRGALPRGGDPLRGLAQSRSPAPLRAAEQPGQADGRAHRGHAEHADDARRVKAHDAADVGQTTPAEANDHASDARQGSAESDAITVTAVLVGLKSRSAALGAQRAINQQPGEPLTAILPGPTLQEVWEVVGAMEKTLFAVSAMVVLVGFAGMLVALLSGLNERRREMAILRSVGARPLHVFTLILGEAGVITLAGIACGLLALQGGSLLLAPWLEARAGLFIPWRWPSAEEALLMAAVAGAGLLIGLIPAYRTYRQTLADGMMVRT